MTLSILGLYTADNTILDGIILPEGLDLDVLKGNLLAELAELEILYPSAPFMKEMIRLWSMKEKPIWERQYKTVTVQYDMLKNYDITIDEDIDTTTDTHNNNRGSDVTTNKTFGYNADTGKPAGENTVALGTGNDASGKVIGKNKRHEYGDASLRTTQDVLKQERDISTYNIYDIIINSFKDRFCLSVW
jgi:hypothetical protein